MARPRIQPASSATQRPRRRGGRRTFYIVAALLIVASSIALRWYWRRSSLHSVAQRGLATIAATDSSTARVAALDHWEQDTADARAGRERSLIELLLTEYKLEDPNVRALLTRVTGADFGARRADWIKWLAARTQVDRGEAPSVPAAQRVRLTELWTAPIGTTAWFSTIIPIDGKIYVASLGADYAQLHDDYDGVVCVDGATGESRYIFQPPDPGPRDIIGIAAGSDVLFVACRNETMYCISPEGDLRWKKPLDAPPASAPMGFDVNGDGTCDAVVCSEHGVVSAFNGRDGHPLWSSGARRTRASQTGGPGAVLAAGDVVPGRGVELLVTEPNGQLQVLTAANGRQRWHHEFASGTLSGPIVTAGMHPVGPVGYVGDRSARVWSLLQSGDSLQAAESWDLYLHQNEGFIASLRTLPKADGPPTILACPSQSSGASNAGVCAVSPGGVEWRVAPGGAIWATPLVADFNGDREVEVCVTTTISSPDGGTTGNLSIFARDGQLLLSQALPAAVEASPVVADVNGDQKLDLLVPDQRGNLRCYETGTVGAIYWGMLGGDSHNTRNASNAFQYGQTPVGVQWNWQP